MRIDPSGKLWMGVFAAWADVCCNDSPNDPSQHWITLIFSGISRAPLKDVFHACKKVTDSVDQKSPLYESFCQRVSSLVLKNDEDSERIALAAFLDKNGPMGNREMARREMLKKPSYKKAIVNSIQPNANLEAEVEQLIRDFQKEDDGLKLQAMLETSGKHPPFFSKDVDGRSRGTKTELENFVRHGLRGCYDDPLVASEMFVPAQSSLPKKDSSNGLMPLYSLRGTGPVESINNFVNNLTAEAKRVSAQTAHMRMDIFVTKHNLTKDARFEHITKKPARPFEWFIDEELQRAGTEFFAESPSSNLEFPPELDLAMYDEPIGMEFSEYCDWEALESDVDAMILSHLAAGRESAGAALADTETPAISMQVAKPAAKPAAMMSSPLVVATVAGTTARPPVPTTTSTLR